jgi:hypothetical protein
VKLRVRSKIDPREWSLAAGLPVSTVVTIIGDLLADREDESAVAQIVQDAIRDGLLSLDELVAAAGERARDYGHTSAGSFVAVLAGDSS